MLRLRQAHILSFGIITRVFATGLSDRILYCRRNEHT